MKISIIVPVYNAEKTIEYCIDSIITQKTKFEIELILVEDYSTDRSYEICLALKKKYTEIKLYRTNGKGVSAARNTGLSHSTGDVVGFCDSDDIYEKDVFEKTKALFSSITSVNVVQALAVVLIYLCLQPFSSSEYKIYLLIGVVLNIFSGLLMQFARGLGDMLAYSVSSFLTAASTVVLNVVFVAVLKLGAHGMFIATMCGIAINCIYLFFKLKAWKYYKPKLVDLSLIKEVCGYSLPLVPNQISGWILSASDRTIIAKFLSVAENGVYSVANKFSNLVGTFYGFFNLAWVETVSVHYNDSDRDEFIGDMMETVSNLFVSICVGIIAIMPFVFPVMVNQQYGNAYYQIPILLIAVIFQILVGLYSAIYIALKKSSTIARTTIAGAIINVLVNLALIRFIGLYAASISTLVSYASTALYRRIDIRKYIKIKVNVKNILLNSVAVVFVTLSYYFNITILNVAALVIACIYAVGINWKLIKMFFAEIRKYKKEGN